MKKLKLITTLSSLGIVAITVPVVVTSCNDKDEQKIIQPTDIEWKKDIGLIKVISGEVEKSDNFEWYLVDKDGQHLNPNDYKISYSEVRFQLDPPEGSISCTVKSDDNNSWIELDTTNYEEKAKFSSTASFTITVSDKDDKQQFLSKTIEFKVLVLPAPGYDNQLYNTNGSILELPSPLDLNTLCATQEGDKFYITIDGQKIYTTDIEAISLTNIDNSITSIGDNFLRNATNIIGSFEFPSGSNIKTIGNYFLSESGIEHVEVNYMYKLENIGDYFCYKTPNLKTAELTNNYYWTNIGDYAFEECTKLETLMFSNNGSSTNFTFGDNFAYNCTSLIATEEYQTFSLEGVYEVGANFMAWCTSLTYLDFSTNWLDYMEIIGDNFFADCTSLEVVCFNDWNTHIKHIGNGFFKGCTSLTDFEGTILYVSELETIGDDFMSGCINMTQCGLSTGSFPLTNVKSVGNNFLYNCSNLNALSLGSLDNVETIGDNFLYNCSSLDWFNLDIIKSTKTIGDNFLYGCKLLTQINMSGFNNLTSIGNNFLEDCNKVSSIYLPQPTSGTIPTLGSWGNNIGSLGTISKVTIDCGTITLRDQYKSQWGSPTWTHQEPQWLPEGE
ncbi:MAG: leucine-rich repeat protein [Malacoplasma sp.]|nr:leucine-rich repeat protein [Malacoplasma sp.]